MPKPVPLGARGEAEERVTFEHTLTKHHPELPPVLSTPEMIRIMEKACFYALMTYHEPGEINVGTAIHVEHRSACGVGALVMAEAQLESIEGRFHIMRVRAWAEGPRAAEGDGATEKASRTLIGTGTVHRAFVNLDKVMEKVKK